MLKNSIRRPLRPSRFYARDIRKAREAFNAAARARFNDEALAKISSATHLMEDSHRGQSRKGTEAPYAIHPIRTALSVLEEFGLVDSELVCAALLHDTLEDTAVRPEALRDQFGTHCADLVVTLTRREGEQREDCGDRIEGKYLQRIIHNGDDAVLLKLADKLDNLRDAVHHPSLARVKVFVSETFSAYIPLAQCISEPWARARAERLLLESAAQTGDADDPEFLVTLLECMRHSLAGSGSDEAELNEIALPEIATRLYLYFNPDAQYWVESDGTSVLTTRVPHLQLATRIARSLGEFILGRELEVLLRLAGLPAAFALGENKRLWDRAALHLVYIQRLLREPRRFGWFDVLTLEPNLPLLLALVQSRTYLPASWRCPLWSQDLGATLSRRVSRLSRSEASILLSRAIGSRLALTRYIRGSGTLLRAGAVFGKTESEEFSPAARWAFRIASEYLDAQSEIGQDEYQGLEFRAMTDLDELWDYVKDSAFESSSLPQRGPEIAQAAGLTNVGETAQIETTGLNETQMVFEQANAGDIFRTLVRGLVHENNVSGRLTWIDFDALEWEKRRNFWSTSKTLRAGEFAETGLEKAGVRLRRWKLRDCEVVKVLPARRFALQDRLPELAPGTLDHLAQSGFSAAAMFDALVMHPITEEELWLPRIYRVLDTIEDLDSENVQAITVSYEGPQDIPPLKACLPLPLTASDPKQQDRKRFLARYLVAQIYTCAVVRWVRRVTFSCSAVNEAQFRHALTEEELKGLAAEIESEYGYRQAYANYIERYGYDPFLVVPSAAETEDLSFGREQIKQGLYLGIDIGGSFIKFELFRDGEPLQGTPRPNLKTPREMDVAAFCRTILLHCNSWLAKNKVKLSELHGVGVSWPGAVRENRLAGASGVLRGLHDRGIPFRDDDAINRLPALPLAASFQDELERIAQETDGQLDEHFTVAIQNDGDAEALGNHALRLIRGEVRKGGKIFVKLGTSVAGGRITAEGAVAEEVAEYGKIVLNLNCAPDPKWPGGTARYYASAVGVRQLSRTFLYEGELIFGIREGLNDEGHQDRIEPVELGMLLPLFEEVKGEKGFLNELIRYDNQPPREVTQAMAAVVERWLETGGQKKLMSYIKMREAQISWPAGSFQSSLDRTIWLCTGRNPVKHSPGIHDLPRDFPIDAMARTVVGTVGLFSQLALQLSHLIAQLYNVYRRGIFSEVILSGGVLAGETGDLVESQTKAFLSKYYDKIYGSDRPLVSGAVARANYDGVSNAGVFGAALAANRMRQVTAAQSLARTIHYRLKQCEIGAEVRVEELIGDCSLPQASEVSRRVLEAAVVAGSFVWIDENLLQRIS